jgi:hypothetical protein
VKCEAVVFCLLFALVAASSLELLATEEEIEGDAMEDVHNLQCSS